MNNAEDSNRAADDAESDLPPPSPIISANDQEETEKLVRKTRTIELLQFCVNLVLAIIGVIAICIYYGQLQVMKGQLGEIIRQYPEIQKQAKAATDAVQQVKADSADNARKVERQLTIAEKQARAAIGSTLAQQRQVEITDRAWIQVEVTGLKDIPPNALIGGGIRFGEDGQGQIGYAVVLRNFGRAVATDIRVREATITMPTVAVENIWLPVDVQKGLCTSSPKSVKEVRQPAFTVFPGSSEVTYQSSSFETKNIPDRPEFATLKNGKPVGLYLVGCVDYRYGLSPKIHQTGFVFEVYGGPGHQTVQTKMTISADEIRFEPFFLGGAYAY